MHSRKNKQRLQSCRQGQKSLLNCIRTGLNQIGYFRLIEISNGYSHKASVTRYYTAISVQ